MRPAAKRQLEKDKEKGLKDLIRIALKKGTILSSKNGQKYEIVGSWYGDIVMSNTNIDKDDVLLYEKNELVDFINDKLFSIECK